MRPGDPLRAARDLTTGLSAAARLRAAVRLSAAAALAALAALVPGLAACAGPPPVEPRPTATVEELMRTLIDPAADAVWDAVVTEVTPDGVVEIRPETDGDWTRLRRHAVTLAESANLLLVEGRRVAASESRSELPGIDLHPDAIEELLAEDWDSWAAAAQGFGDTSVVVLDAVDARDVDALLAAGAQLDLACERCHAQYWYPGHADPRPADP